GSCGVCDGNDDGVAVVAMVIWSFFFSSRRRHTRLQGDWSSDVCSSDLRALSGERLRDRIGQTPLVRNTQNEGKLALQQFGHEYRSEERRVGKECRSHQSPEH